MTGRSPYNARFYQRQRDGSALSASTVVPHLLALTGAESVADFGCGVGTWLRAFLEAGVLDAHGVDGPYVRDELLEIPTESFIRADLAEPIDLKRRFDLVVSLEVAEHLPAERAATFVETLTRHGSLILFSAAVPGQGGKHHVNEQWPNYWNALFAAHGYQCLDCLRPAFWANEQVEWWYRQNMLLFVANDTLTTMPRLTAEPVLPGPSPMALVHPDFYQKTRDRSLWSKAFAVRE